MPKKLFERIMPDPKKLQDIQHLKIFEEWLNDPNLWHLNRYSVATAFSIGLFLSFMPFPGHMLLAGIAAIILRANLPLSIVLVWVSNPFTIPPMFYYAYKLGTYILNIPPEKFHIEISLHWLIHELEHYYAPLLIGAFLCGTFCALMSNVIIRLFWRFSVSRAWRKRAKQRAMHK